jgi:hypothetical protein
MGFNDKIKIRFEATSNVSMEEIFIRISEGKKRQSWTDFLLADSINYKEISVNNGQFEIIRTATPLNAFKANGKIVFIINEIEDNKTQLKCEILPFNGSLPIIVGLLIGGLTFWSLLVLFFSRGFQAFILIVFAWTAFSLFTYVQYFFNKLGLIDYAKKVISELTRDKKPSR